MLERAFRSTAGRLIATTALALLVAGCADTGPAVEPAGAPATGSSPVGGSTQSPTGVPGGTTEPAPGHAPSTSPGVPPSTVRPPSGPPKKPTDNLPSDRIAGRITRGGSGPCYGLVTDDGVEYALYGQNAGTFAAGSHVRVTIAPQLLRISCGSGRPASIVEISPVR